MLSRLNFRLARRQRDRRVRSLARWSVGGASVGAPTARQEAIPIAVVRTNSPPSLGDPSQDRTRCRLLFMVAVTTNEVAEEAQKVGRIYPALR